MILGAEGRLPCRQDRRDRGPAEPRRSALPPASQGIACSLRSRGTRSSAGTRPEITGTKPTFSACAVRAAAVVTCRSASRLRPPDTPANAATNPRCQAMTSIRSGRSTRGSIPSVETNLVDLLVPARVVHEQGDLDAVVDV